ncbi:MAG: diguanylate cyclase domain-containing protein [Leptolyngbyaceae cyanobacterium]
MISAKQPTVLVIEDDEDSRTLLEVALTAENFRVLTSSCGHTGLEILAHEAIDLILLDLMLPDIDGFQCCSIMFERLGTQCPPVLVVTGLDDTESVDRIFAFPVTDFIVKPFNLNILIHRISRVLRERELLKQLEMANAKLQEAAQTDSLTGIANRHHFQTVLMKEWGRLLREQKPLGLLLCDLDAFKQYNDRYGHLAGDVCLKEFARIIKNAVNRPTDLVTRYGGEEFIVLLPNTAEEGLATVDFKIRQGLAEAAVPHDSSWVDKYVTYSAGGISAIPQLSLSPDELIDQADNALYKAKARGRNCTIIEPFRSRLSWSVG